MGAGKPQARGLFRGIRSALHQADGSAASPLDLRVGARAQRAGRMSERAGRSPRSPWIASDDLSVSPKQSRVLALADSREFHESLHAALRNLVTSFCRI